MKNIENLEKNKCRTCYNTSKGLKLLTSLTKCGSTTQEQKTYGELLKDISNINILDDTFVERLPQSICESCARRLKAAHSFIEQAQEVNERLLFIACQLEANKQLNCLQEPSVDILPQKDIKVEDADDTDFFKVYEPQCFVELKVEEPEQSASMQTDNVNNEDILSIKNDEEAKEINKSLKELSVSNQTKSDNEDTVDNLKSTNYKNISEIDSNNDVAFSSDDDGDNFDEDSDWRDKKEMSPPLDTKERKKTKGKSRKAPKSEEDDVAVPCNECHKIFSNAKKLARHKSNTHIPEDQKCTCPICGRRFSRPCNMYTHMRSFHGPDTVPLIRKPSTKERIFQCDKCERNYTKKSHLKVHIKEKHCNNDPEDSKGNLNNATNEQTDTQQTSAEENPTQDSEKPKKPKRYEVRSLCSVCGSSFASRTHLIVHMRRHTGERPFKCDLCERAYPRLSELVCHRRIHTGEKPFKCKICDKAFRVSSKMSTHMRSHSDIRPYKCTQCERSFKYSKDLNIHIRIHTGERPYSCNVCGSTFTQTNTLKAHRLKLGHMEEPAPIIDNIG